MKVVLFLILLSIFSPLLSDLTLWEKAREIAKANWNLVPSETQHFIVMRNTRNNNVIFDFEVKITHKLDNENNIINELIDVKSQQENSTLVYERIEELLARDITPEKTGILLTIEDDNPGLELLDGITEVEDKQCTTYQFVWETTINERDMIFEGKMWIDVETGAPVHATLSLQNTPLFVKNMKIEKSFYYDPVINLWYENEIMSITEIVIPFRRMTLETKQKLLDPWSYSVGND